MKILGISCYYHDSAACLVTDGEVVAAAQEERFTRRKNSPDLPLNAVNFCLQRGGITSADLDCVAFYEKPFLKFSRVLAEHAGAYPFSFGAFMRTMPAWLGDRLSFPLTVKNELGCGCRTVFVPHHLSHAASAFLVSPFEEAAILTADGVGEWATTAAGRGRGGEVKLTREIRYPDSLGLFYTALTTYLGFEANEGEGKTMALAGMAEPDLLEKFRELITVGEDGSYRLNRKMFDFSGGLMYRPALAELLGEPRAPGAQLTDRHLAVAATLQKVVEDALIAMARGVHRETGSENLCLAGGVFLNCVANHKILENTPFRNIFIQPAAGDAGGALGAACYAHCAVYGGKRNFVMRHARLGPEFGDRDIRRALAGAGLKAERLEDPELFRRAAALVAAGSVTGWFRGRLEFGPRALGGRSIIGNPANPRMKEIINERVKHREPFRPYAPAVLEERAGEYFQLLAPSPFMLLAPRVRPEKAAAIPAACHDDGTARVQTVSRGADPDFHGLISAFEAQTGLPLVLNTSFNRRGEPIVCRPEEALAVYRESKMDALVLGNYLLEKNDGTA